MKLNVRLAKQSEAQMLSELALRAKAYWPYDEQFIRDCADDLRISPERAGGGLIFVGEIEEEIVGFYGFGTNTLHPEMTHLFVEPNFIGTGVGGTLWKQAVFFAKSMGWNSFEILADPYAAEHFYLRVGCKPIGDVESSVRPGRMLPLLRFDCD